MQRTLFDHGGIWKRELFSDKELRALNISIVTKIDNAIVAGVSCV